MYSEFPESCREAVSTTEEIRKADYCCTSSFSNSPQLSTVSTISDSLVPKFVYRRRKLQRNSLANSSVQAGASTTKSEGACPSIVISDDPSVGVLQRCKAPEDTASTTRSGWDFLSIVGSNASFAVGEQHVVSNLVYGRRKLQRNSLANSSAEAGASTTKSKGVCPSIVVSDAPSVGDPEQSKSSEDTASTTRSEWDFLSIAGSNAPFAVGEQHVVSNLVYGRRKLQRNSLANSSAQAGASTAKSEGVCPSIVVSDAPTVGDPKQSKSSEDTASTTRSGWDYLSTVGSDAPFAVRERHVVSNLVYRRRKLQRKSLANPSAQAGASTTKSEGICPSIVVSDAPTVGDPEQSKSSEDTATTKRSGLDYLLIVGCDAPSAVGEQHVVSKFVYRRRKMQRYPIVAFSGQAAASTKRIGGDCLSVVSSDAPGTVGEQARVSEAVDDTKDGDALMPFMVCNGGADALKSDLINGCSFSDDLCPDEASGKCRQRVNEVDCANESCSSSRSDIEAFTATMKTELHTGECSSSRALIVEANMLEKDRCISKLKDAGICERVCSSRSHASAEGVSNNNASSRSQSCKICGNTETTLKMLVCDKCEEAFHVSCCNPRIKKVPTGDWFCSSCLKHKHKMLRETISRRSSDIIGEKGRSSNASAMGESNPIKLMLKDTEPYTTAVQIGKGFQAEVPDWSGPINDDPIVAGEPLEVDARDINVHEMKSSEPSTLGSICNWLQCREVDAGNGTICGKWRRAPLFVVQTDNWECFYSVFWDPSHADCAAPQELETDQVMKQLKCIRKLKQRLAAKRRKWDQNKKAVLLGTTENVRKTRKSMLSIAR